MKVYVASSWRNEFQQEVVRVLRDDGHTVYDFRDKGFGWSEVDPDWKDWSPTYYLAGLDHPAAERGFKRDMNALLECDVCVYVMPCGVSASWEAGFCVGAGKPTYVFVPALREPDLMVKMATLVASDFEEIRTALKGGL